MTPAIAAESPDETAAVTPDAITVVTPAAVTPSVIDLFARNLQKAFV